LNRRGVLNTIPSAASLVAGETGGWLRACFVENIVFQFQEEGSRQYQRRLKYSRRRLFAKLLRLVFQTQPRSVKNFNLRT